MITIQSLDSTAFNGRLEEIDRSEHVTLIYQYKDGQLTTQTVDWQVPVWTPDELRHLHELFDPMLAAGATLLAALDGDQLAGLAILRYHLTPRMAQLAFLYVNQGYRRRGIARRLTDEMIRRAKADGATEIYVSATPSGSAVGFYRGVGFELAPPERIHPELFALEPEDIHLIMRL